MQQRWKFISERFFSMFARGALFDEINVRKVYLQVFAVLLYSQTETHSVALQCRLSEFKQGERFECKVMLKRTV